MNRTGTITAHPNPIEVADHHRVGVTTLEWSAEGVEAVEVRVDAPDGPLFSHSDCAGSATTGAWVCEGMTFYLQDVSGDLPLTADNTLALAVVHLRAGTIACDARALWQRRAGPEINAENALVSVIIPCYNQSHFLAEAIESVLVQTYTNFEIIVVDDGSTDHTPAVAARYPAVRYLRQRNQGVATARNTGWRASRGDYLVFLDADDRLLPAALEIGLISLGAQPESAFVYGHVILISSDGVRQATPHQLSVESDHYLALLRWNYIWTPGAVMYRRAILDAVGGFDPRLRNVEDYELNLRITKDHPVYCHDQVVLEHRQHEESKSRNAARMLKHTVTVLRSQQRHLKGKPQHVEALRAGLRCFQDDYGERLLDEVETAVSLPKQWRAVAAGLLSLLRYYPAGLAARVVEKIASKWHIARLFGKRRGRYDAAAEPERLAQTEHQKR